MKDQHQRDRQSLANSQYRRFMHYLQRWLTDDRCKSWVEKEAIAGSPTYVPKMQFSENDNSSGYSAYFTRPIDGKLVVSFSISFQAGLKCMCNTEVLCTYALADSEEWEDDFRIPCIPLEAEDVIESNDPFLWKVWQVAEKYGMEGHNFIRKCDLPYRANVNMNHIAEATAAKINPLVRAADSIVFETKGKTK